MTRLTPMLALATLTIPLMWMTGRRLYKDFTAPPAHPEATPQQLHDHLKVKAYFLVEGFTGGGLPVQLEFPTLYTVLHVGEGFKMRYRTRGYAWTPMTDSHLSHAVQVLLLSE